MYCLKALFSAGVIQQQPGPIVSLHIWPSSALIKGFIVNCIKEIEVSLTACVQGNPASKNKITPGTDNRCTKQEEKLTDASQFGLLSPMKPNSYGLCHIKESAAD